MQDGPSTTPRAPTRTPRRTVNDPIDSARLSLMRIAHRLRRLDGDLERIGACLPDRTGDDFDLPSEIGAGARVVRTDLLRDAIDTLETLATADEAMLRRRFDERCEMAARVAEDVQRHRSGWPEV